MGRAGGEHSRQREQLVKGPRLGVMRAGSRNSVKASVVQEFSLAPLVAILRGTLPCI